MDRHDDDQPTAAAAASAGATEVKILKSQRYSIYCVK